MMKMKKYFAVSSTFLLLSATAAFASPVSVTLQNFSNTVMLGDEGGQKIVVITNTSDNTLPAVKVNVTDNGQPVTTPNLTNCQGDLAPNASCQVYLTLSDTQPADHSFNFNVTSNGQTVANQAIDVGTANPHNDDAVIRIVNTNVGNGTSQTPHEPIYVYARNLQGSIRFDANGVGTQLNTGVQQEFSNPQTGQSYAYEIKGRTGTVYLPPGDGGRLYISYGKPLVNEPNNVEPNLTNTSDKNYNTQFAFFEYSYLTPETTSNPYQQYFFFDLSNVDGVYLPLEETYKYNGDHVYGDKELTVPFQQILGDIKTKFDETQDASNTWANLVINDPNNPSSILRILSPHKVAVTGSGLDPFFKKRVGYFSNYVNDLWNYYRLPGHDLYIDVSELQQNGIHCGVLKGHINANGEFEFTNADPTQYPNCTADVKIGGGSNQVRLNFIDFFGGAPGGSPTFGPDGTLKSVVGRDLVSAQSVGLLPDCSGSLGATMSTPLSSTNMANAKTRYFQGNYSCLILSSKKNPYQHVMYNLYSDVVSQYFDDYTYPYSDFLADSDLSKIPYKDVHDTPVTLILGKMSGGSQPNNVGKLTAPTNLVVNNVTGTAADLSWTASTDTNPSHGSMNPQITYTYKLTPSAGSTGQAITSTSTHLTGLTPNTNYTVQVIAHEELNGQQDAATATSSPAPFTTAGTPPPPPAGTRHFLSIFPQNVQYINVYANSTTATGAHTQINPVDHAAWYDLPTGTVTIQGSNGEVCTLTIPAQGAPTASCSDVVVPGNYVTKQVNGQTLKYYYINYPASF